MWQPKPESYHFLLRMEIRPRVPGSWDGHHPTSRSSTSVRTSWDWRGSALNTVPQAVQAAILPDTEGWSKRYVI